MPMRLDEGWNQIQFNLSDFTRRAYGAPSELYTHGSFLIRRQRGHPVVALPLIISISAIQIIRKECH